MYVFYLVVVLLLGQHLQLGEAQNARCDQMVDVMFVLDSSGSITTNFPSIKRFVTDFIGSVDIGSDATLVGVVRFSTDSSIVIPLGSTTNNASLITSVDSLSDNVNGFTYTDRGIANATSEFVRAGRQGADRIMIVITDGQSQDELGNSRTSVSEMRANEATSMDIRIIAIRIGPEDAAVRMELNAIASGPGNENTFIVNDFNALSQLATNITTAACPSLPAVCRTELDVVFAVALYSPEEGTPNFTPLTTFVSETVADLGDLVNVRVGVVYFSNQASVAIGLGQHTTVESFMTALNAASTNIGSNTVILAEGIEAAVGQLSGGRPDVRKVIVVVSQRTTSNIEQSVETANTAKQQRIEIIGAGIGGDDVRNELGRIATELADDHVFTTTDQTAAGIQSLAASTNETVCTVLSCSAILDIVIVVDQSGSINSEEYSNLTQFLSNLTSSFQIGPDAVQVGIVRFDTTASLVYRLGELSRSQLIMNIRNLPRQSLNGFTNIADGLLLAEREFMSNRTRSNAKRVILLITDGVANRGGDPVPIAINIRNGGIQIFSFGIGNDLNITQLNSIANRPTPSHVFIAQNFNPSQLSQFVATFATGVCVDNNCQNQADIMFVLDNSGSIAGDFGEVIDLVRAVVNRFQVNANAASFGVILYREDGAITVPLGIRTNRAALERELNALSDFANACRNLCTNTSGGLRLAQIELDGPRHRPEAKKVIILVTDGQANVGVINNALTAFADTLHNDNIEVFVVGVTDRINKVELNGIGSDPDSTHVFLTNNFDNLFNFADNLSMSCMDNNCQSRMDIVFVVDSSGSIGVNFPSIVQFLVRVVDRFNIGPNATHVGLVRYSTNAFVRIRLGSYRYKSSLLGVIGGLNTATSGRTNIPEAIRLATGELMGPLSRPDATKIMIVLTDGVSNEGGPLDVPSLMAQNAGIEVFVFGIGDSVDPAQLDIIASRPTSLHVFRPQNFSNVELNRFIPTLAPMSCQNVTCFQRIDLIFVLDSSSAVLDEQFRAMTDFVAMVVTRFNISDMHTVVGVVQYGSNAVVTVPIRSVLTVTGLMTAVEALSSTTTTGTPNIANAINVARGHFPTVDVLDPDVKKIMVVFANQVGEGTPPNNAQIMAAAQTAVNEGIEVYAIGTASRMTLDAIASDPNDRHVFMTPNVTTQSLFSLLDTFTFRACTVGGCRRMVDVVFVVDSSGSIGNNFMNILTFVTDIVNRFNIGPNDTQVGFVRFSRNSSVPITLAQFNDKSMLVNQIMALDTTASGTTNTAAGISDGNNQLYNSPGSRRDASKLLIVITDGRSNEGAPTITAANDVKNAGAEVIAVGIGMGVNVTELNIIATDSMHVFRPTSFDSSELGRFTDEISNRGCTNGTCDGPQDLAFVLDSSGSIGDNFGNIATFVRDIVNEFMIGPASTQVAVVRYSSMATTPIDLASIPTKIPLLDAISGLSTTTGGTTNTAAGIQTATQILGASSRPAVRRVMFVLTDGRSDDEGATSLRAAEARMAGIEVYAFGITNNVNLDELNSIASDPDNTHRFIADDFNLGSLRRFIAQLSQVLCLVIEPAPCVSVRIDIVIILDESGSISMEEFRNMTIFVGNVISQYRLGPNNIQVGVITYSNDPTLAVRLGQFTDNQQLRQEIVLLTPFGGVTRTDLALQLAATELTGPRSRIDAAKIAILLTDGASTERGLTTTAATNLRNRGVEVFVVGVGNGVDVAELNEIATDLDSDHVLQTTNFDMDELNMLTTILANRTCNAGSACSTRIDMSFVLDSSNVGINAADFDNILNFTNTLVDEFVISSGASRVSVVQYSETATVPVPLSSQLDQGPLSQAIAGLMQTGSGVNIIAAINAATNQLTASTRMNVKPVMIVVLGAQQTVAGLGTIQQAAQNAKDRGIEVIAIGSGVPVTILETIATNTTHAFSINSFSRENLNGLLRVVTNIACSMATIPPPPEVCLEQWSQCSRECHNGIRTRRVFCCDANTREELPMQRCNPPFPPSQERCGTGPCFDTAHWVPGPWSACSRSCGTGNRVRVIECHIPSTNELLVSNEMCENPPQPRPRAFELCNRQFCCTEDTNTMFCRRIAGSALCSSSVFREQVCCASCNPDRNW